MARRRNRRRGNRRKNDLWFFPIFLAAFMLGAGYLIAEKLGNYFWFELPQSIPMLVILLIGIVLLIGVVFVSSLYKFLVRYERFKNRFRRYDTRTSIGSVDRMNLYELEKYAGGILRRKGYMVEASHLSKDGEIDIAMSKAGRRIKVRIKRMKRGVPIGPAELHKFCVVYEMNADVGWYFTTGEFSQDAVAFARTKPALQLVNRAGFLEMVKGDESNPYIAFVDTAASPPEDKAFTALYSAQ